MADFITKDDGIEEVSENATKKVSTIISNFYSNLISSITSLSVEKFSGKLYKL